VTHLIFSLNPSSADAREFTRRFAHDIIPQYRS
jgi:hypothetical protein